MADLAAHLYRRTGRLTRREALRWAIREYRRARASKRIDRDRIAIRARPF